MNADRLLAAWISRVLVACGFALVTAMVLQHPHSLFVGALSFFALAELCIRALRVERRFAQLRGRR